MEFTSVTSPPPNTFRPIQESEGHHSVVDLHNLGDHHGMVDSHGVVDHHGMVDPHGIVDHHGVVDQQVAPDPQGAPQPLSSRTPKLGNWRQGSDNWSSTGSRQSSRPGSGAQSSSRPPSSHLYCRSSNSSMSEVNFQQLSVSSRRAAFKSQKWSSSFDNPGCQAASPATSARGRRQAQTKSLEQDLSKTVVTWAARRRSTS